MSRFSLKWDPVSVSYGGPHAASFEAVIMDSGREFLRMREYQGGSRDSVSTFLVPPKTAFVLDALNATPAKEI